MFIRVAASSRRSVVGMGVVRAVLLIGIACAACEQSASGGNGDGGDGGGGGGATGGTTGLTTGGATGGTTGSGTTSGGDGGTVALNDCTTFRDATAESDPRAIVWDFGVATSDDRCMRVKLGQTVTWNGNFATHPLGTQGGNSPNPIAAPSTPTPESRTVTFGNTGTFGYVCTRHSSMKGAIQVVE
jgi:plastocyanin